MAVITAHITIDGEPLRRAFVEHMSGIGVGLSFALTDENGSFTFDGGLLFNEIDVRIHCQNSVLRVVNGARFNIAVSANTKVKNGERVELAQIAGDESDHFRLLARSLDIYRTVWRNFRPYNRDTREIFPLTRQGSIRDMFSSNNRIELSYPDGGPQPNSYVEPAGLSNNGYPLAHIRHRRETPRLFGDRTITAPVILPHELGHVFHFAALAPATRVRIEGEYLRYLLDRVLEGEDTDHSLQKETSPLVAYVEAAGIFAQRFFYFAKRVEPDLSGTDLRRAFAPAELSASPGLAPVLGSREYRQVAVLDGQRVIPKIKKGADVEGAVYGAIYVDLARRIGLREAVGLVLDSEATTFGELQEYIHGRGDADWTRAIDAAAETWGM